MNGPRLKLRGVFFQDDPAVIAAMDKAERKPLMKMGAYVRTTAKRSMKPAKRKKEAELTESEAELWNKQKATRHRRRQPIGKVPFYVHSQPGEPPRKIRGDLSKFLYFVWDPSTRSVVVGPQGFPGRDAPENLEHGGQSKATDGTPFRMEARPFMFPALQDNAPKFPQLFANALR